MTKVVEAGQSFHIWGIVCRGLAGVYIRLDAQEMTAKKPGRGETGKGLVGR